MLVKLCFGTPTKSFVSNSWGLFYYTVDAAVRVNTKTEGGEGCVIKIHHKSATTSGTMELKDRKRVRWSVVQRGAYLEKSEVCNADLSQQP